VFFVFVSALCIASYEKDVGLEGLLGIFTGLGVMVVAGFNIIVGFAANAQFKALRDRVVIEELAKSFEDADKDHNGSLDLEELAVFCKGMGMELSHRQWELLVSEMDEDGSGDISFVEFKGWWGREGM